MSRLIFMSEAEQVSDVTSDKQSESELAAQEPKAVDSNFLRRLTR